MGPASRVWTVVLSLVCFGMLGATARAGTVLTKPEEQRFVVLSWGEETELQADTGIYERELISYPAAEGMDPGSLRGSWTISPGQALTLAQKESSERWKIIARNLGLSPDDKLLWTEVVDAMFKAMASTAALSGKSAPPFSLWVSFSVEPDAQPQAELALSFGEKTEDAIAKALPEALTGIELFARWESDPGAEEQAAAAGVKVALLASDGITELATGATDVRGYFCFSPTLFPQVKVDPDFGTDFFLRVEAPSVAQGDEQGEPVSVGGPSAAVYYAPMFVGKRTGLSLTLPRPMGQSKGLETIMPSTAQDTIESYFKTIFPVAEKLLEVMPRNAGLHYGVVVSGDDVSQLYAMRYLLRPERTDLRAKAVPGAMMRFEQWVPTAAPDRKYVRVVLTARPSGTDMDVKQRPNIRSPWGTFLGMAPDMDPAMYAVGASYEVVPEIEVVAGLGLQENAGRSLVWGATLDLGAALKRLFGGQPTPQ